MDNKTCKCGCETPVSRKATYRPGHDAKHVSHLLTNVRVEMRHLGQAVKATDEGLAALSTPGLKVKFLRAVDTITTAKEN